MEIKIDKKWPRCVDHQECPYQYMCLAKQKGIQRLLCCECLFIQEQVNKNKEFDEMVPLSYIIRQPEVVLNGIQNDQRKNYLKYIFQFNAYDLDKQFTKQLEKFELIFQTLEKMKDEVQRSYNEYKQLQEEFRMWQKDFLENCQLNKLNNLINDLQNLEKQFKSEQYLQILSNINSTLDEILKDNQILLSHNTNTIAYKHNNMKKLSKTNKDLYKQSIVAFFQEYDDYICGLNKIVNNHLFIIPEFKLINKDFFLLFLQKIEIENQKSLNKMNLLYEASREGPNKLETKLMWNKIYGKKNLLLTLKSEKDQIFGGYSSCQWKSCQGSFVQDDNLSPFLFSQTQQQIYPIRKDFIQQAFDQTPNNGPNFGQDLQIKANFESCSSALGSSYYLNPELKDQSNTILFGELSPSIIEVEIFELVFQ